FGDDSIEIGEHQRRYNERQVDHHQHNQFLGGNIGCVEKRLEQVDGRDRHDRRGKLDLERTGVELAEPRQLVGDTLEVDAADEVLVARDDHHDQEVGDHHEVDEGEHVENERALLDVPDDRHVVAKFDIELDRQQGEHGDESEI